MPGETSIEWADATWNPVTGCTKVSAGCDHCYAERFAERFRGVAGHPYEQGFDLRLWPERLEVPLRWSKPRRIFVNSMSDLYHADVPTEFIAEVFAVMALARWHTFQVLTKRPQRMKRLLNDVAFWGLVAVAIGERRRAFPRKILTDTDVGPAKPLPNVWLGTSVENQEAAYRIDWLVKTPAAVRFLSCEPLIGPLDLSTWVQPEAILSDDQGEYRAYCAIDWVIAGGESGPDARPMHPDWPRGLRDQCQNAGVAFFFKQWGEWAPVVDADGTGRSEGAAPAHSGAAFDAGVWQEFPRGARHGDVFRVGKRRAGRELDGQTWDQFPMVAS